MSIQSPQKQWWQKLSGPQLWYFVGLITSDGSLSRDGRHIDLTSKDEKFLISVKNEFNLNYKIGYKTNGRGFSAYRIQMGSKQLYNFLTSVGLVSNKSKVLGELKVPSEFLFAFVRGYFDGDGCIRNWISKTNKQNQIYCKMTSASRLFLEWLQEKLYNSEYNIIGTIHKEHYKSGAGFILKITRKKCVKNFLKNVYATSDFAMVRKKEKALSCISQL